MTQTCRAVLALFAEANGLVRLKFTEALEPKGYNDLWAANIEEAAKVFRNHRFDLLPVALNQPLTPGGELCKRLKALSATIPMVLVVEQKATIQPAAIGHLVAVLERPFHLKSLIQAVNALLDQVTQVGSGSVSSSRGNSNLHSDAGDANLK
jgi:DNA-binding response OmpR family regulator